MPETSLDDIAKLAAVRWRVSKMTEVRDILDLLAGGSVTTAKAEEAIHQRISGTIPELPTPS